jgi:hypothetical protein
MVFSVTSVYTLTGDARKTLFQLIGSSATGSSNLASLSAVNYLVAGETNPNPSNQLVFKNQPLSWWLASLNSGAVKYTPVSNNVNWAYLDSNNNIIHISIEISNLLIPNKTASVSKPSGSMSSEITFEPKFGLGRVDTHVM